MRFRKLRVALDVDDVLASCMPYAIRLTNEIYNSHYTEEDFPHWGKTGTGADRIFRLFKERWFFETQPLIQGAQEFVRELQEIAEVFIITAVPAEFTQSRITWLKERFDIPEENIFIASRKDMIDVDVILDDGAHNIRDSRSAYPVLMRKPWNRDMTGMLAVNNFDEFLSLIRLLQEPSMMPRTHEPRVFVLVGPSGGDKNILMERAEEEKFASSVRGITTAEDSSYTVVSDEDFLKRAQEGLLLETTYYASKKYGMPKARIQYALSHGTNIMCAMDICGAVAVKRAYPEQAVLIFVKKDMESLITSILLKGRSVEETTKRILSLQDELKNEDLCDMTVTTDHGIEEALRTLMAHF